MGGWTSAQILSRYCTDPSPLKIIYVGNHLTDPPRLSDEKRKGNLRRKRRTRKMSLYVVTLHPT